MDTGSFLRGRRPSGAAKSPPRANKRIVMSQHRSLRSGSALGAKRNVLKRFERVAILKKRGEWKEGDRVTGLRKTRVIV
jgi:small basic protein (TIGR04137 family)